MGLKLNVSNSLYQLVDHLADNLQAPLANVFEPHFIVTQTPGMNNWLRVQLAERLGIASNCRFLKPNDLVTQIYYALDGPSEQTLSPDSLRWLIFAALDDATFKRNFPFIAQYYENNEAVKRMSLAEKVADLFDQYQIYRPEIIKDWNEPTNQDHERNEWQKFLWIDIKNKIGNKIPDKTRIGKFILDTLKDPVQQEKLKGRISRVNFFGISILTSYHLEIFHALSKHIDISFNLLNPAPSVYWFEDKSQTQIALWNARRKNKRSDFSPPNEGNTLLTNWGKVIQDTFALLFKDDDFLNEYVDTGIEPANDTLLTKIQHDIFHNYLPNERNVLKIEDLTDGSISINSCYTQVREVEVLYNYLVNLINKQPRAISPRDIVVMVSDIDSYAPYIKAIFKSAPYAFPFTIADESVQSANGIIGALTAILSITEENFLAEEVLQLLEWEYIRKRFGIQDTEIIRKTVDEANIRFGITGKPEDDTVHISWMNGLNRIMFGVCMKTEETYDLGGDSFYPLDSLEGEQSYELIRFSHFITVLIKLVKEQQQERSLQEWSDYLLRMTAELVFQSEEDNDDYLILLNYIKKINQVTDDMPGNIGFDVFKHNFISSVSSEYRTGNFATGGVTFCSLIPMRSIPFKVVALLGLDFDKFPRKQLPVGFDLMQKEKRRGDRNIKENDKHLFLETLLSAHSYLFISYLGKNVKDNSLYPPSTVIDELIDYIIAGVYRVPLSDITESELRATLVVNHPLHNFSVQPLGYPNFLEAPTGRNVQIRVEEVSSTPVNTAREIDIDEFIGFFKNPFKYFHNKILNIHYNDEDLLLRDTEHFEIDSLQTWTIKQDLLFLSEEDIPAYIEKGIKKGFLPLKGVSDSLIKKTYEDLKPIIDKVHACIDGREEHTEIVDLTIGEINLTGKLNKIFGSNRILVSFSKNINKNRLDAYINHLIATAAGLELDTLLISGIEDCIYQIKGASIGKSEALEKLNELVGCFLSGCERPFVLYPRFENDPDKLKAFDLNAFKKMISNMFEGYYPCTDQYIINEYQNGFFDQEDILEDFLKNSATVFGEAYKLFVKK